MKANSSTLAHFDFINWSLCILLLSLFISSCNKNNEETSFDFQASKVVLYPENKVLINFNVVPKGNNSPFQLSWIVPDSLSATGPYSMYFSNSQLFEFEITDSKNEIKKFTYEIFSDTIDTLKYDYRNELTGLYNCTLTTLYQGESTTYADTLTITKSSEYNYISVQSNRNARANLKAVGMAYNSVNGTNGEQVVGFYAYHSYLTITGNNIRYSVSGPMGNYYTNTYTGIKIEDLN